jgi:HKD family nuclease
VRRSSVWILGLVATLVPATVLANPGTATADVTTYVVPSAIFNDPAGTTTDQNRIRDYLTGLINGTAPGAEIRVSMYGFTDDVVADALVSAQQRGVTVRVILDDYTLGLDNNEYPTLREGLGTDLSQPSWVLACPPGRACIADRDLDGTGKGINHSKFFMFSQVGGASNVLVQTSANMTATQRTDYFNNAVTLTDAGIYGAYKTYFDELMKYGTSPVGLQDHYVATTSGPYKSYFFPRHEASGTTYNTDAGTDTVKLILDNVNCSGGTQIRVAMYAFSRTQVAQKLVDLKKSGCSVYLANDAHTDSRGTPNLYPAVEDIVYGKLTQRVECNDGPGIGVHSKYLLINGTYDGRPDRKLVFTGSHNYTYPALRANDEALLKIDNAAIYEQYRANHDRLMQYCAGS